VCVCVCVWTVLIWFRIATNGSEIEGDLSIGFVASIT